MLIGQLQFNGVYQIKIRENYNGTFLSIPLSVPLTWIPLRRRRLGEVLGTPSSTCFFL